MCTIFTGLLAFLWVLSFGLQRKGTGNWLPTSDNMAKQDFEKFALVYSAIWIGVFGVVVVGKLYEWFEEVFLLVCFLFMIEPNVTFVFMLQWHYMGLCVSLATPFFLQPFLAPSKAETNLPISLRYSFKANVWIAIFSFIGNYWYTHYFYSVLKAKYTFSSHRLNDVPIALYFATHFYFVFYHTAANMLLRKIETTYIQGTMRTVFFWATIFCFSYFTAFMETLTISGFPDYCFENRYMAYTVGSMFYGLYFIVSYPAFFRYIICHFRI